MTDRTWPGKSLLAGLVFLMITGCGRRHENAVAAQVPKPIAIHPQLLMVAPPPETQTYQTSPPALRFDYPGCWRQCKAKTADFTINGPSSDPKCCPSLCLDIPKLPWHIPGIIPIGMVASGYVDDLRKNQIPDAIVQEQISLKVAGSPARRITCVGHFNHTPWVDVAVIMIHADHVYILSADSDDSGRVLARHTLDDAIASLKWTK